MIVILNWIDYTNANMKNSIQETTHILIRFKTQHAKQSRLISSKKIVHFRAPTAHTHYTADDDDQRREIQCERAHVFALCVCTFFTVDMSTTYLFSMDLDMHTTYCCCCWRLILIKWKYDNGTNTD